ncbi:MAG: carotenoid oxygenase family protein [Myxococcaceae bacterium]|nr:carotenoid oxygenase family protein [Myxococcaceae bacterium]MCI0673760.1 carotenoid oxygenase family protein [Myxococcaceae bacterium]
MDSRSRSVRYERFLAQQEARRRLSGRYRNRYTNDPLAAELDPNTSNTHIVWHGGKLMALKEDGLPYEIGPVTLETRTVGWRTGAYLGADAHEASHAIYASYQLKGDAHG